MTPHVHRLTPARSEPLTPCSSHPQLAPPACVMIMRPAGLLPLSPDLLLLPGPAACGGCAFFTRALAGDCASSHAWPPVEEQSQPPCACIRRRDQLSTDGPLEEVALEPWSQPPSCSRSKTTSGWIAQPATVPFLHAVIALLLKLDHWAPAAAFLALPSPSTLFPPTGAPYVEGKDMVWRCSSRRSSPAAAFGMHQAKPLITALA